MVLTRFSEIDFQLNFESLKKELESTPHFSVRKSFKAIDEQRFKFLTEGNIRLFLKKMGHQPVKAELISIIRRFDVDGDSKISFQEFSEAIQPVFPCYTPDKDPLIIVAGKQRFSPHKHSPAKIDYFREDEPSEYKSADKHGSKIKRSLFQLNKVREEFNQSYLEDR